MLTIILCEQVILNPDGSQTQAHNEHVLPPTVQKLVDHITKNPKDVIHDMDQIEFLNKKESGVGVYAKRDIKKGEVIFQLYVPNPNTSISIFHHRNYDEVLKIIPHEGVVTVLLLYYELHNCDNNDTLIKLYAQDLEKRYRNPDTAIFYSDEELNEFQSSRYKKEVKEIRHNVQMALKLINNTVALNFLPFGANCPATWDGLLNYDTFLKYFDMISSRTFGITSNEERIQDVFCFPIIDMINTEAYPNSKVEYMDTKYFNVITTKDIPKGTEITIDYQQDMNYLIFYGFCMENNTHSEYKFDIKEYIVELIHKKIKNENLKIAFLKELKENKVHYYTLKFALSNKLSDINYRLINFIRAVFAKDQIEALLNVAEEATDPQPKQEVKVLKFFKKTFTTMLSKYSTTVEEDEKLIHQRHINYRIHCARVIRRDEKLILKRLSNLIDETSEQINLYLMSIVKQNLPSFLKPIIVSNRTSDVCEILTNFRLGFSKRFHS